METKQFPEKWAVRGSQEFAEFLKRCDKINNPAQWHGEDKKNLYYIYNGNIARTWCDNIEGYTEVTLEDLIAHYEPSPKKLRVRVIKSWEFSWYKIGECYDILEVGDTVYHIDATKAIGKEDCEIINEPTHPKWMPLTESGKEYHISEEFGGALWGRVKEDVWMPCVWFLDGEVLRGNSQCRLIPYNPRIHELEEKITSKRSELADLEGELNTLKGK